MSMAINLKNGFLSLLACPDRTRSSSMYTEGALQAIKNVYEQCLFDRNNTHRVGCQPAYPLVLERTKIGVEHQDSPLVLVSLKDRRDCSRSPPSMALRC